MTTAARAVFITARTTLVNDGRWGDRVFRDIAPSTATLPLCIMTYVGGGTIYEHQDRPKNVRLRVMAVGSTQSEADDGAAAIEAALANKGTQEATSGALDASAYGWQLVLVRAINDFVPPVELDENREIYRAGVDIDFKCERT